MAALIPVEKCLVLPEKYFWLVHNATGYHLGLVPSSGADGAPLVLPLFEHNWSCRMVFSLSYDLLLMIE